MSSENPFAVHPRPTKVYHREGYAATSPLRPELSQKGKTVLITGGSSGIGYAIATAFAQAGTSTLAIVARREGPLAEAKRKLESAYPATKVLTFTASMTDAPRINAIAAELGTIDVLVLNAGVGHKLAPLLDISSEDLQENFNINVVGAMNVIRAFVALPPRTEGAERTVIHTSSAGIHFPLPGVSVTMASKIAINYLITALAAEHGDKGIRAFAYHPAIAYTEMAQAMGFPEESPLYDDMTLPANHAVWLTSPEADFLKGRFVWAHWDVEELMAKKKIIEENPSELTISLYQNKVLA